MATLLEQIFTPGAGITAVVGFLAGSVFRTIHNAHYERRRT